MTCTGQSPICERIKDLRRIYERINDLHRTVNYLAFTGQRFSFWYFESGPLWRPVFLFGSSRYFSLLRLFYRTIEPNNLFVERLCTKKVVCLIALNSALLFSFLILLDSHFPFSVPLYFFLLEIRPIWPYERTNWADIRRTYMLLRRESSEIRVVANW